MGIISDILDAIFDSGGSGSTDSKKTDVYQKDDTVTVRNSSVIVDHDSGTHDTIWSRTDVNTSTGEVKISEGGHGPNYQK